MWTKAEWRCHPPHTRAYTRRGSMAFGWRGVQLWAWGGKQTVRGAQMNGGSLKHTHTYTHTHTHTLQHTPTDTHTCVCVYSTCVCEYVCMLGCVCVCVACVYAFKEEIMFVSATSTDGGGLLMKMYFTRERTERQMKIEMLGRPW